MALSAPAPGQLMPAPAPVQLTPTLDSIAPLIGGLRVVPRCTTGQRAGGRERSVSVRVRYKLSEDARVAYALRRRLNSRPQGKCPQQGSLKPRPGARRPGRYQTVLDRAFATSAGEVTDVFGSRSLATTSRLASRPRSVLATLRMRPGTYIIAIRALDAAGNRADAYVKFWC
jgi:hypothetical protein